MDRANFPNNETASNSTRELFSTEDYEATFSNDDFELMMPHEDDESMWEDPMAPAPDSPSATIAREPFPIYEFRRMFPDGEIPPTPADGLPNLRRSMIIWQHDFSFNSMAPKAGRFVHTLRIRSDNAYDDVETTHYVHCPICGGALRSVSDANQSVRPNPNRQMPGYMIQPHLQNNVITMVVHGEDTIRLSDFIDFHLRFAQSLQYEVPILDDPTGIAWPFENLPFDIALTYLHGCTSVLVISTKGIWMCHIWEIPNFQSREDLEAAVNLVMVFGNDEAISSDNPNPRLPPLRNYVGIPFEYFDWEETHRVLIVTPRKRHAEYNAGLLEFPDEVAYLMEKLEGELHHTDITVHDYYPLYNPALMGHSTKGTVLVHYTPAMPINPFKKRKLQEPQNASVKVWVDGAEELALEHLWRPSPSQILDPEEIYAMEMY